MSKKDFDIYYNKIYAQYREMFDAIHEFEEACQNKIISDEQLESYKKTVERIKENYMTLSYIKYLLNIPVKPAKKERYYAQNKKLLNNSRLGSDILKDNKDGIDLLRGMSIHD